MLRSFKKFADFVNNYREKPYSINQELDTIFKKNNIKKVLEVGCNVRPVCKKQVKEKYNIILHGIDPDQSINLKETKIKFEYFEVTDLESFETTEKYDLILLNMVMEHIKDNFGSFKKLKGLISEKGIIVCRQPSNLHPFSILNRILSHDLKEIVLKTFLPWSKKGARGWKSYYHKCNYIGFKNLCKKNHLEIIEEKINYNASHYFSFFPPLFLIVVLYEEFIRLLGIKLLCSDFYLVISHKDQE